MKVKEYKRKVMIRKMTTHLLQIFIISSFVLLWEFLSRWGIINEFLFSSPSAIFELLSSYIASGELFSHLAISLYASFVVALL